MNNRRFFYENALGGIRRMRGRYLPLGIIAALTAACSAFADAKRGVINDMSAMLIEDSVDLYRQVSEAGTVKRIGGYINAGALIIGVISVIFISLLMQRTRIYEVGVYYSIGFRRNFIIRTLLFETFSFTAAASIAGVILGSAALPCL
ncbi:MAG: FtsX-like permease family protein [Clostridiales bacterium]|nr:FtsX-like permease family protein [Clostridiales bacterium]